MISRLILRNVVIPTSRRLVTPSITYLAYRKGYSTEAGTKSNSTPKAFKSSSFSQPKDVPKTSTNQSQHPTVPQEDIDDFNITKLIHGNTDMKIAITKRASNKLTSIAEEDKNLNTALKVEVESGGCHGFQYNLKLTDLTEELKDENNELLVFKRMGDDGEIAHVILDDSSLQILQDSKVDYTKELIGSQFKIVDSPYTSTACGCGASFDFDFEKLEKVKEKEANK
mmetsp:Transcript_4865/g.4864  ORF Transcript_4865/g.4864 Transcript_4865/m.4864 type:complete len:226 (+) Transcript_4865:2565-3242(+)